MPVRDGRWVSWDKIIAEAKAKVAAEAGASLADDKEAVAEAVTKIKRATKRNAKAAKAAVAEATGAVVDGFDAIAGSKVEPPDPEPEVASEDTEEQE